MEQATEPKIKDVEYIAEWRSMLNIFSETVEGNPPVSEVKEDLLAIMEAAKNTFYLTGAQRDAICARCRNYINGVYGLNKVKDDYLNKNS